MKKIITLSLFIFWAVVTATLTAGLLFYQNNKSVNVGVVKNNLKNNLVVESTQTTGNNSSTAVLLSLTEISKHNNINDCWLLINNKVYNVTSYSAAHPGGVMTIDKHCGKEATQGYNTKDKGQAHSSAAAGMLIDYYIGDLNQAVAQKEIQQTIQNTNAVVPKSGERESDDD